MFWVARNKDERVFGINDKRPFGVILNECKKSGLDSDIAARLERFNQNRVEAIHKYLLGVTNYDAMRNACMENTGLDAEVGEWVRKQIGVPWR